MKIPDRAFVYLLLGVPVALPFVAAVFDFDPGAGIVKILGIAVFAMLLIVIPVGILALLVGLFRR